jgi:cytochrome c peroxidase
MSRTMFSVRSLALLLLVSAAAYAQLPPVVFPPENPYSASKAVLGKILFWEEQMSSDDTTACGTCHIPTVGGGDPRTSTVGNLHPGPDGTFLTGDDIQGSRGVIRCVPGGAFTSEPSFFPNAQVTRRKSPSFIGAGWAPELFWDGRASATFKDPITQQILIPNNAALESQAVGPITSDVEMACTNRTHADVAAKIASVTPMRLATNLPPDMSAALAVNPTYAALFTAAFGDAAVTPARIGMAIATYERTLVPDQTPWDLYTAGNLSALTPSQVAGLNLFTGTSNCDDCHVPPLFTDHSFANIGVRPDSEDTGRFEVTAVPADQGKFRVPSLRNVGLRGPFFHNGGKLDMQSVVLFYKLGGDFPGPNLDSRMVPITISHTEELQLADFVENALTDPRVLAQTFPFDRPTLNSEITSNFPAPYGYGTAGTGAITPIILAPHTAFLGNHHFTVGIARGLGGAPAALAVSAAPAAPGAMYGPNPLWINPGFLSGFWNFTLAGTPAVPGAGYVSLVTDIAYNPAIAGATAYLQAAVGDILGPGGLAMTSGTQITLIDFGP